MKIVFLDRNTIGDDIDISILERFGELKVYPFTEELDVESRISGFDVIVTNKSKLNSNTLRNSKIQLICITATGTDNIDLNYCNEKGIPVCNVTGYSTESVVQHTFAMLLSLKEHIPLYHQYTKSKGFVNDTSFRHLAWSFHEICNKNYGIIGMGTIGRRVAEVATAFGCKVYYWSSKNQDRSDLYTRVDLDNLLEKCDIISIHSPLTPETFHLFGKEQFKKMKSDAILINVGRGDIIIEEDLADAIENNLIGGAAIDVLSKEPMSQESPFLRILDDLRFLVTPHIAWAAVEARQRCMQEICLNIEFFNKGERRNRVDTIKI